MVDRYGTPFSAALHVAERYRLIDGTSARDLQQNHESVCFGAGKSSPPANPGSSWVSLRASGLKTRFLKVGPRLLRSAVAVWDHGGPDRTHGEARNELGCRQSYKNAEVEKLRVYP